MYLGDATSKAILIFSATATGNAKPVGTISGSKTQLGAVNRLYIGASKKLWATNYVYPSGGSIEAFNLASRGDAAPQSVISGSLTGIDGAAGLYADPNDSVYAASSPDNAINYFSTGSSGNVAPARRLVGPATQLNGPTDVWIDPISTNLVVTNLLSNTVLAFMSTANGNVAPLYDIAGAATLISQPVGITFDAHGVLYVTDSNVIGGTTPAILAFAKGARGNVAPIRNISGPNTTLKMPELVRVDALGYIYVVDSGEVKVFAPRANGDVAPVQDLTGGSYFCIAIH